MNTTRKAAIIAFILLLSFKGYSLTIYEISYEFKTYTDYPRYTAFLVRYGNGTGFMRIRYYKRDFSETLVVNMDFDEIEGTATIDGLLQKTLKFQGKNPTFIMNTSISIIGLTRMISTQRILLSRKAFTYQKQNTERKLLY